MDFSLLVNANDNFVAVPFEVLQVVSSEVYAERSLVFLQLRRFWFSH